MDHTWKHKSLLKLSLYSKKCWVTALTYRIHYIHHIILNMFNCYCAVCIYSLRVNVCEERALLMFWYETWVSHWVSAFQCFCWAVHHLQVLHVWFAWELVCLYPHFLSLSEYLCICVYDYVYMSLIYYRKHKHLRLCPWCNLTLIVMCVVCVVWPT